MQGHFEITFDNMGVFDLGKNMFVMECLHHVLANDFRAVLMDVQYDDVRLDTEVTRRNMIRCITCKKTPQKGAKALDTVQKYV